MANRARVRVKGVDGLARRLDAIGSSRGRRAMLGALGADVAERAKRKVPRKTGNLGRSIEVGRVTDESVHVHARANYAAHVEFGTKAHPIYPRRARVLRFAASSSGQRLSGTPRRGAAVVYARYVRKHPGTRPQPYMVPAIRESARKSGMREQIVNAWNRAD